MFCKPKFRCNVTRDKNVILVKMITSEIHVININQKYKIISQKGSKKIRTKDQLSVLLECLLFECQKKIGFASLLHDCLEKKTKTLAHARRARGVTCIL